MENHDVAKQSLDVLSAGVGFLSFLNLLSPLFGLIAAVWTLMRIAEMVTGKTFAQLIGKKKVDSNAKHK
jgi:hypothetical protein